MEKQIIECVPNFSEGRDKNVIEAITAEIRATEGVSLLDVDPGEATNRTVVTFVGEPAPVMEAAFRAVRKAAELIDMSRHHGAHPRMGATDVLPLIPVAGITLEECAELARKLGKRIADELGDRRLVVNDKDANRCVCHESAFLSLSRRVAYEDWPFSA